MSTDFESGEKNLCHITDKIRKLKSRTPKAPNQVVKHYLISWKKRKRKKKKYIKGNINCTQWLNKTITLSIQ